MKHILSLLVIGIAGFKLAQSFMNPETASTFLGMDMNIWLYRLIWIAAAIFAGLSIMKSRKLKGK